MMQEGKRTIKHLPGALRVKCRFAEVAVVTAGVPPEIADDFAAMPKSAALGQLQTLLSQ